MHSGLFFGSSTKIITFIAQKKKMFSTCSVRPGKLTVNFTNNYDGAADSVPHIFFPYISLFFFRESYAAIGRMQFKNVGLQSILCTSNYAMTVSNGHELVSLTQFQLIIILFCPKNNKKQQWKNRPIEKDIERAREEERRKRNAKK